METINLLEFLNKIKVLDSLDFATCSDGFVNFLDLISYDEQFTQKINMGVIYTRINTLENYLIIDGLSRIVSLSLLLHAVCECYKKTTQKNEQAIKTIRKKYLLRGDSTKLRMPADYQEVYEKIIFGERLSAKEKRHPLFKLLHGYWQEIKEDGLRASYIFNMLHKVCVTMIEVENVNVRDFYYTLNKTRELNMIKLIDNYTEQEKVAEEWKEIKDIYSDKDDDVILFLSDFFKNKFNYKIFNPAMLYEYFTNYFETMRKYKSQKEVIEQLKKSAKLYNQILNIDIKNNEIKNGLIQIKMLQGADTYPYLLSVYEDYVDGNLNEATFIEILSTINDYLKKRRKSGNSIDFNELIKYLNAFLACK